MAVGLLDRRLRDEAGRAGHDDALEVVAARGHPVEVEARAALLQLLARAVELRQALGAEEAVGGPLSPVLVRTERVVGANHVQQRGMVAGRMPKGRMGGSGFVALGRGREDEVLDRQRGEERDDVGRTAVLEGGEQDARRHGLERKARHLPPTLRQLAGVVDRAQSDQLALGSVDCSGQMARVPPTHELRAWAGP